MWIVGTDRKEIIRLDPVTRRVLARVPLGHPDGVSGVATSADAMWAMVVSNYDIYQSALVRIDPATNRVTARIPLRGTANAVTTAFNAGPVLLTSGDATVPGTPALASRLAAIPGGGVVVGHDDGTLVRIDGATGRVRSAIALGAAADNYALAPVGNALWVTTPTGQAVKVSR